MHAGNPAISSHPRRQNAGPVAAAATPLRNEADTRGAPRVVTRQPGEAVLASWPAVYPA